ncbi:hypothetical protein B0H16DRAFT_1470410 [Mycena metata]|uniref:Uncharacterized protein n=1 Tax=Mycena metata TaxID=1033252 RepID=A0AAD7MRE4_9AGAR|nr:hypothetical protein B0H16DRAFT_1470410 [Mycena metata]
MDNLAGGIYLKRNHWTKMGHFSLEEIYWRDFAGGLRWSEIVGGISAINPPSIRRGFRHPPSFLLLQRIELVTPPRLNSICGNTRCVILPILFYPGIEPRAPKKHVLGLGGHCFAWQYESLEGRCAAFPAGIFFIKVQAENYVLNNGRSGPSEAAAIRSDRSEAAVIAPHQALSHQKSLRLIVQTDFAPKNGPLKDGPQRGPWARSFNSLKDQIFRLKKLFSAPDRSIVIKRARVSTVPNHNAQIALGTGTFPPSLYAPPQRHYCPPKTQFANRNFQVPPILSFPAGLHASVNQEALFINPNVQVCGG